MIVYKNYEQYSNARLEEAIRNDQIGENDFPRFNAQKDLESKRRNGFPEHY